jgi:AcrR family transcriptional regulator
MMRVNFDNADAWEDDSQMTTTMATGRTNQKQRTRAAIIDAARALIEASGEVSMPLVAQAALVSEATTYRYFPDLVSLLREALSQLWTDPVEAMHPVDDVTDPVQRVAHAANVLLSEVAAYQGAVRVMMSAAITRPGEPSVRPARRVALIDQALEPLDASHGRSDRAVLRQLKLDLALVISAEAFFTLVDLCGLSPKEAVASGTHAAKVLASEAVRRIQG